MRCCSCGAGFTWIRLHDEPAVCVHRAGNWLDYCGRCFQLERHEHQQGDEYQLLLVIGRVQRFLTLELVA